MARSASARNRSATTEAGLTVRLLSDDSIDVRPSLKLEGLTLAVNVPEGLLQGAKYLGYVLRADIGLLQFRGGALAMSRLHVPFRQKNASAES